MMTKFKIVVFFLIFLIFSSCALDESDLSSPEICPALICAVPEQSFKLKFVDKNSEVDLIFNIPSNGIKYNLNNIKIYSTRFKKDLDFRVDSTNKLNRFLVFSTAVTDEFIISLSTLPVDKLSAETQFIDQPCCDQLKLTKLTLNSTQITFNPATPTIIILKK